MNIQARLKYNINIADIHSKRLSIGLEKIKNILPITQAQFETIDDDQIAIMDMVSTRFARLQDIIGAKIFPTILSLLAEEVTNYRDNLNSLERLNILTNASWWMRIREIRNNITHDYPEDSEYLANNFNNLAGESAELLLFWEYLKNKIEELKIL